MKLLDILNNEKIKENVLKYSEQVVLFSSAFILASMTMDITMLSVRMPEWVVASAQIVLTITVMIRIVFQTKEKMLWMAVLTGAVYYLSWNFYYFQLIALLSVACVGISYRKILKAYLIGVGTMAAGTIILALGGGVENLVYMKDGFLRSSMGIIFPTDFATIVLFLAMSLWVYWEELSDEASCLISAFSIWVSWYIARSYTSTLCSLIFLAAVLYRIFEKRIVEPNNSLLWIKKTVNAIVACMFPAMLLLMFVLMIGYAKGYSFAYVANNLMSGRVRLSLDAYYENGVSLFGHQFRQEGAGGSTYGTFNYEFVDSSYPRILLFYGVVILTLVCILWVFLTVRAIKADRRRMAFVMAIIAFHSLSEHHFIEPVYNIFLILPFSSMELGIIRKQENRQAVLTRCAVCIGGLALSVLLFPKMLSMFRITVLESDSQGLMLGMAIAMLTAVFILINAFADCLADLFSQRRVNGNTIILAAFSCLVIAFLTGQNIRMAVSFMSKYDDLIKNDEAALKMILNAKTGKVYADKLGKVYQRKFERVSISAFDGEDLARFDNITIIVDEKKDSQIFLRSGFLYTRISDAHAIYTNDEEVINALKSEGYQLTAFCSAEYVLDLADMARINGLKVNEDGSVDLGGEAHSLIFGEGSNPFEYDSKKVINLYAGEYTANYQLKIDPVPYERDYPVCRIIIDAYAGENNLRTLTIYRSWFDENGQLDAKVSFNSGNNTGVIFRCIMEEGQTAILKGITWQRTPDYDIRPFYNNDHDKIRDEYYDKTGKPVMNKDGFASCSYHYWDKVTIDEIHYYDLQGQPVNTKKGYATVLRTYNVKRQLIKEEYLDTLNNPVMNSYGYAIQEWEYDQNGNAVLTRFLDIEGKLILNRSGYAQIHYGYDNRRRIVEETYFGINNEPIKMQEGYFGIGKVYEEEDSIPSELVYKDETGQIIITDEGCSVVKLSYEGTNTVKEKLFCDKNGNPVMRNDGYSLEKRIFDLDGNIWIYQYCGLDGEPVMSEYGYAEVHRTYDENGFIKTETYYDKDGRQIELEDGFAMIECENDNVGNLIRQRFYTLNGDLKKEIDSDFWLAVE